MREGMKLEEWVVAVLLAFASPRFIDEIILWLFRYSFTDLPTLDSSKVKQAEPISSLTTINRFTKRSRHIDALPFKDSALRNNHQDFLELAQQLLLLGQFSRLGAAGA